MKEGLEKKILEVAREEFFKKGFKRTSMRNIAKKADITFSNIYYYFKDKDALLLEVVKPLMTRLDQIFSIWDNSSFDDVSIDAYTDEEYQEQSVRMLTGLALQYKEEFNLLLFNSQGSVIENIEKKYIDRATQSLLAYMKILSDKYPQLQIEISEPFIRMISTHSFTVIGEIVSQDISDGELDLFMQNLVSFNTSGWKGILYKKKYGKELAKAV